MINRDEWLKMAREAGFKSNNFSGACTKHSNGSWVDVEQELQSFASAILERAAVECEDQSSAKHGVDAYEYAKAIRALKTQGE